MQVMWNRAPVVVEGLKPMQVIFIFRDEPVLLIENWMGMMHLQVGMEIELPVEFIEKKRGEQIMGIYRVVNVRARPMVKGPYVSKGEVGSSRVLEGYIEMVQVFLTWRS